MSQEVQSEISQKKDFFKTTGGLKVPSVGLVKYPQFLRDNYINLTYLYSTEKNDFVDGIITENRTDNETIKEVLYKIKLDNYVMFNIVNVIQYKYVEIRACKIKFYVEDIENLIQSEWNIQYEKEECVKSYVTLQQLNSIKSENEIIRKLLYIAKFYLKSSDSSNVYYFEIPHVENSKNYTFDDIKQAILDLRQPLDQYA